ncbi:hypothetical protein BDV25DRAFT_150436 [Aspergillus avenaceus]|uniref:Ubiquitin carrier protein n=1 Tax=Aspergillus avenaceus TaxID=36643 RepID=A0A5N6U2M2_ASPAV|nr:hypothetical protein BDV25DRAFT_150436 [Aspergillus avenaceus]
MVVSSFVRRGMERASEMPMKFNDPDVPSIHLSGWLAGLFVFSVLAYFFVLFSIEYTYGMVVATLAAVEDTNPDIYVRIDTDFDANKPVDPAEPELAAPPKPITSKLRSTIVHLRARAGFWSRFRGFGAFITYTLAQGFLYAILPVALSNLAGQFFCRVIVGMALANLDLTWVHVVISEPSPKRFYQRIPDYKTWLKFAPVVALEQCVVFAAFYIPLLIIVATGNVVNIDIKPTSDDFDAGTVYRAATAVIVPCLSAHLASIPARAITIRVAASMLPEEDEAIVPFDRSFGGKVVPAILGGSGKLGIADAWKSFDGPARIRYLKVFGKTFAMECAAILFFALLLGGQVYAGAVTYGIRRNGSDA